MVEMTESRGAVVAEVEMGVSSSGARSVRATIVQAATVFYNTAATLEKAERLIMEVAAQGSQLEVFPEAFFGGYPCGNAFRAVVGSRTPKRKEDFCRYYVSATDVPGLEVEKLAALASRHKLAIVIGCIERAGGTLYYTTLFFNAGGEFLDKHSKLMPTALERLMWGFGDGSMLPVFDTSVRKLGTVICWENRMLLFQATMYGKGIKLYCAPTADARILWQAPCHTRRRLVCVVCQPVL